MIFLVNTIFELIMQKAQAVKLGLLIFELFYNSQKKIDQEDLIDLLYIRFWAAVKDTLRSISYVKSTYRA